MKELLDTNLVLLLILIYYITTKGLLRLIPLNKITFIGFQFPQPCHRCVLRVCELVDGSYLEGLLRRVELAEQKRQLCVAVPGAVFEGVHEEKGGDEAKLNLRTKAS